MKKRVVTGIMATMIFASPFLPTIAQADTLEEMEQQKNELDSQSSELNNKIEKQDSTLNDLESEKSILESDITTLQTQIDETVLKLHDQEQKLEESKAKVEQLKKEIELLRELIDQRTGKLENQARSVQTDGNASNLIGLLITAESFTDLVGRIGVVNQLVTANKDIVTEQATDQKALETNEVKAQAEKVAIEDTKNDIELSKNNLVAQKAEMDDKIVQVAIQYDMTEEEKNTFVKEQQVIATQTSTLSETMQKERQRIIEEEQARQLAVQEAAEAAAVKAAAAEEARLVAVASQEKAEQEETARQERTAEQEEAAKKAQTAKKEAEQAAEQKATIASSYIKKSTSSTKSSSTTSSNSSSNTSPSTQPTVTQKPKPEPVAPSSNSDFIRPSGGYMTSAYGYRVHPITGDYKLHGGTDFGGGGAIVASKSGSVVIAGYHSDWGYYVKIDHGNGLQTLYAHMVAGSLLVTPGQQVSQGQQIGTMGTTGSSTGVHLHFEMYKNGSRVDPASYL
ncbi:peptidoglycan DD-metalloendopeptidase family protein [Carnobacterium alterfunditum]|uniref:peptidoglycan DD-metalloendopeptidase family protein n=1 Tax=Carnobacterium alterfunditum TaxID=28230 RepID=UPI0035930F14